MESPNLLELARAFSQASKVALWIESDWSPPVDEDDFELIASQDWLGIWSVSRDSRLADKSKDLWKLESRSRHVVLVPQFISDALGSPYKFSYFAPCFFLNGLDNESDPLNPYQREDARNEHVRELMKLGGATLLICGTSNVKGAFESALQVGYRAEELSSIILVGYDESACNAVYSSLYSEHQSVLHKIQSYEGSLDNLIKDVYSLEIGKREDPHIRIGLKNVSLKPFLEIEPPITSDFSIVKTSDLAPSLLDNEDDSQLLIDLFAGKICPWRSISRGLSWTGRPEYKHWSELLTDAIKSIKNRESQIVVIEIEAEPGSGLTTLLCQLGVIAASHNCPTLFHINSTSQSYQRLRTFLTDIYRDVSGSNASHPTVIIFDVDSSWDDLYGLLDVLPSRLRRDGRRAVIIRSKHSTGPWCLKRNVAKNTSGLKYVSVKEPLTEYIPESIAQKFAEWVDQKYSLIDNEPLPPSWINEFKRLSTSTGCPFLITVSLLLIDKYREAAKLGERLLSRIDRVFDVMKKAHGVDTHLSSEDATEAFRKRLSIGIELGIPEASKREDVYSIVITLASMSCLRIPMPRRILTHIAGIQPADVFSSIIPLSKSGLIQSSDIDQQTYAGDIIPSFYGKDIASMQFTHHEYGRLLLEYLSSDACDARPLFTRANPIVSQIFDISQNTDWSDALGCINLDFLRPILERLRPGQPEDRLFAEHIAQRFLRVQRQAKDDLAEDNQNDADKSFRYWQWLNRQKVLEYFDSIPEELVITNASILHSRAITRAKCTLNEKLDQARPLYRGAEEDLLLALELIEETGEENPTFILTTLGMVYVHWAKMEREHNDPENRVLDLDKIADKTLREARALQLDSTYPSYHLANHKVNTAESLFVSKKDLVRASELIAESLEILSGDSSPGFRSEWEQLFRRAVVFLSDKGKKLTEHLIKKKNILGWTIRALDLVNGQFPKEYDVETFDEAHLKAWEVLNDGFELALNADSSPISNLLRYCIYSFGKDRTDNPEYGRRHEYISREDDLPCA